MSGLRIGVVGAGIVGLAVARRLGERDPRAAITVLDKEDAVATHQTGHNSGVVHAGIYYAPGSLKARLCRRGMALLQSYCGERDLPYEECGKLVVALTSHDVAPLRVLQRRATENGVADLRWLDADGLRAVEPHAAGIAALHSPHTAIVDYPAIARAFAADVAAAGGTLRLGFEVRRIMNQGSRVHVSDSTETLTFDRLVICAGLQADRVARLAGDTRGPEIVPFRGEYYRLRPKRTHLVRGLIYPVPDPSYPFLGVHFTRRIDGHVDIGPNAVLATAREGYRRRYLRSADLLETLAWPGFRRLAVKHWRMGLREIYGSLSPRAFLANARRYLPELTMSDVVAAPSGVRAQAVDVDGTLVDDFRVGHVGHVITIRNAPSPAATSSLAIAEHAVAHILD